MASGREEAHIRCVDGTADGQGSLVAVGRGIRHAQNGRDGHVQLADALEAILHLLALGLERCFIRHMSPGAAAASGIGGAVGCAAMLGRLPGKGLQAAESSFARK